ncbi:hypothetical protein CCICO_05250 [Corynebacterium ciconiae DSM 44920]|nr:hypothetical protein CCICO_05250 [Corynebacterium ciconiae DSM 44920]
MLIDAYFPIRNPSPKMGNMPEYATFVYARINVASLTSFTANTYPQLSLRGVRDT